MSGAMSHYFGLAHSFWAMCFIANTYAVVINDNRSIFKHPIKFHLIQSVFCWLGPAVILASCLYIAPPGYKFLFVDLMMAGVGNIQMAYFTVTLPMQVTLGVSLCLLWSIVWHLRKVQIVNFLFCIERAWFCSFHSQCLSSVLMAETAAMVRVYPANCWWANGQSERSRWLWRWLVNI